MKTLLTMIFCSVSLLVLSQTLEMEEAFLNKKISEMTDQAEILSLVNDWKDFKNDYGEYPNLPYNPTTNEIEYSIIKSCENIPKDVIFNRILEWAAINFGRLDEVLHYSDLQSGKIILKGSFDLYFMFDYYNLLFQVKETGDKTTCFQTIIFTIVENKLKIEFKDLKYTYYKPASVVGNFYIPPISSETHIRALYPITRYKKLDWKKNLSMMDSTNKTIMALAEYCHSYVLNYEKDYNF